MGAERLRVLVVDDEAISSRPMVHQLRVGGYVADAVDSARKALERLANERWEVVVTDLRMPGMDGLDFLRRVKAEYPDTAVLLMSAYGTVDTAVEAMRAGAHHVLTKPFSFQALDVHLQKLAELCFARREVSQLRALIGRDPDLCACGIVRRSAAMRAVCERITCVAQASAPVLVVGDTGTGKEVVARAIHQEGPRSHQPFVAVSCGAIPRELSESELFGHEKGAFTGAVTLRLGCFERADGGTLFLDDVDDLPLDIQVKLLRVLQEGTFTRVGGATEVTVDVRVVAVTKLPLTTAEQRHNRFRDDLYYRLAGLEIRLPPLRDRLDDVLPLATHFLQVCAANEQQAPKRLTPAAAEVLLRHTWPGNVRELRRAIESAVVLSADVAIEPESLPSYLHEGDAEAEQRRLFSLHLDRSERLDFQELVADFEEELISWALRRADGNRVRAAELLGLARTTFQSRLAKRHGTPPR